MIENLNVNRLTIFLRNDYTKVKTKTRLKKSEIFENFYMLLIFECNLEKAAAKF